MYLNLMTYFPQAIQVVNAANGKAILAHPSGQVLRQIRPLAIPTNVNIASPQSSTQAVSSIPTMSLVNNPNIRLRLPDTPTPPNMLNQTTPILSQQGKTITIASSVPASGTMEKSNNVPPVQVQTSQPPRMVTIQGHSVILNSNLPSNTQLITPNVSGAGTIISTNNSSPVQPSLGVPHQMKPSTSSVIMPQSVMPQQKIIQVRGQQPGTAAVVVGNSPNVFRVPTPTSSSATVIVDASGSSQTPRLPQAVLVSYFLEFG